MDVFSTVLSSDIKLEAKRKLAGNWGKAILVVVIYFAITMFMNFIPLIGSIALIAISGPLALGIHSMILTLINDGDADIENMFDGFKDFGQAFLIGLLRWVFILLWSLLAFIPMIVFAVGASFGSASMIFFAFPLMILLSIPAMMAYYSYSMVFFVKINEPELTAMEVLSRSKEIMMGYKMKLFLLNLSFIGWIILASLSFGIGYLWLTPYMFVANGVFYTYLSKQSQPVKKEVNGFEDF
ncbi:MULTISPECIES: DUF975 family protein [unclassified Fusibacter]|uniref:DUF975 family protein n=1 Tax=unclassified Fusibacter TaxID=2624464 RepID=UPI001012E2BE|nr:MULTISPECIES: DUF975 family protein [unclassified Fusibacter]MCK8058640.1 DUF975 family protein [Fusibacter sp. A2]NPE21715.1 DUF975 family protein [Fusibacter sp. A1]RXV61290.1 DUF975 family protein [Fusibacter sp. A1]